MPLTPADLEPLVDSEEFQSLAPDDRGRVLNGALREAHQYVTQNSGWTPEKFKSFGTVANGLRETALGKSLGEHVMSGIKTVGNVLKDSVASMATTAVSGYVPEKPSDLIGLGMPRVGSQVQEAFTTNMQKMGKSIHSALSSKDDILNNELAMLKEDIDQARIPQDGRGWHDWLDQRNDRLKQAQTTAYTAMEGDTPENRAFAESNSLLGNPRHSALLLDYMQTRDPTVFDALRKNIQMTPGRAALENKQASLARDTNLAQMLESTLGKGAGNYVLEAGDPLEVASNLLPMFKGAKALQAIKGGRKLQAAGEVLSGAAVETLSELGSQFMDDPGASWEQRKSVAKDAFIGALGLVGLGAGGQAVLDRFQPTAATQGGPTNTDNDLVSDNQAPAPTEAVLQTPAAPAPNAPPQIGGRPVLLKPATLEEQALIEAQPDYWTRAQQQIEQQVQKPTVTPELAALDALPTEAASGSRAPGDDRVPTMAEIAENGGRVTGDGETSAVGSNPTTATQSNSNTTPNLDSMSQADFAAWLKSSQTGKAVFDIINKASAAGTMALGQRGIYALLTARPELRQQMINDILNGVQNTHDAAKVAADYAAYGKVMANEQNAAPHRDGNPDWTGTTIGKDVKPTGTQVRHKSYVTLASASLAQLRQAPAAFFNGLEAALKAAGFNGQMKMPVKWGRLESNFDNIVMHGATEADAKLGAQVAEQYVASQGMAVAGVHFGQDAKGTSHTDLIATDVAQHLLQTPAATFTKGTTNESATNKPKSARKTGNAKNPPKGSTAGQGGVGANAPVEAQLTPAPPAKGVNGVAIDNADSLIQNGGGIVEVSQNGRKVSYDKFGITIDGNTAEVAFVELAQAERGKGIGLSAYEALGKELAARGITLQSSRAQYSDGRKLWEKLASKGLATKGAQGVYKFTPPAAPVPVKATRIIDSFESSRAAGGTQMSSQSGGKVNNKSVADALKILADRLPGLQHGRVRTFANAAELLASNYARRESFTTQEQEAMQEAEAFFDNLTGHTIVFTDQITLQPGETPIRAVARVLLHERVGHEGINVLLQSDAAFAGRVAKLVNQIPVAELDAIEAEGGYGQLDRMQLALEWLARQAESIEGGRNAAKIEGGLKGVAKQLWQAFKEMLARMFAGFSRTAAAAHEIHEVITRAREAALNGTADPTTPEALGARVQFSTLNERLAAAAASVKGMQNAGRSARAPFDAIAQAYRATTAGSSTGFVPIAQVFDQMRKAEPWLTQAQFLERVREDYQNGRVLLEGAGSTQEAQQAVLTLAGTPVGTAVRMAVPGALQFSLIRHKQGKPFEVRHLMVRSLLLGSPLPTSLSEMLSENADEKAALDHAAARIGSMIELGVSETVKRTGRPVTDIYQLVNDVFDGRPQAGVVLQAVSPALAEAARKGRNMLDEMSHTIGLYLPAGTMRTTIMQNLGSWMKRGYAVFDATSNWNYKTLRAAAEKGEMHNGQDARKLMQNAVKHIVQQNPALAGQVGALGLPRQDTELSGILVDLLDRDTAMNSLIPGRARTVRKDVSSLMRRKTIAPEIRALMGEYTSPLKRYAASASFQTQFLAKFQAQQRMRQIGLSTNLFSTTQTDTHHHPIPETDSWGPLAGLYTTRELLTALQQTEMIDVAGSDMPSLIGRAYKAIMANAKMNLVALNPKTTAVNFIGGGVSALASGDIVAPRIIERYTKALKMVLRSGKPTKADLVNANSVALRDAEAAERAYFISSGLLRNNVTLAEIDANTPEALMNLLGDKNAQVMNAAVGALHGAAAGNALGRMAGGTGQAIGALVGGVTGAVVGGKNVQWAYGQLAEILAAKPDAMWKVAGFYAQRRTALEMGMTVEEASKWAVERVRNTYPDYSKVPTVLKHLSLLPIIGNFVSFNAELVRNLAWNLVYAKRDLGSRNPALRSNALRRIAGMSAAYLLSTPLLNTVGELLFGWLGDDDEREDIFRRWLASSYDKHAALTFKSVDSGGATYFKQSYLIPQGIFGDMLFTAARHVGEGEFGDALLKPTAMLLSQFGVGENLFKTYIEAMSGEDAFGRRIYARTDSAADKLLKGGDHLSKTLTDPGWAKLIEQAVRHYYNENSEELGRVGWNLIAVRERRLLWDKAVKSVFYNFRDQIQTVRDDAKQQLDPRNRHLLTNRAKIVEGANARLAEIEAEIVRFESDMERLKVPSGIVTKSRREVLPRRISPVKAD